MALPPAGLLTQLTMSDGRGSTTLGSTATTIGEWFVDQGEHGGVGRPDGFQYGSNNSVGAVKY